MSLVGDVLTALETAIRAAIPAIQAGDRGLERGVRWAEEVAETPHVFLWEPKETGRDLILRQRRLTVHCRIRCVRRGDTHDVSLNDFESIKAALVADPTLAGVIEQSELDLEGIFEEPGDPLRVCDMTFTGIRVR